MLKQVRGALKGIVAWFVIALLVLAFAAWGVPELRSFTRKDPVRVGDIGVSQQEIVDEFNRAANTQRTPDGKAMTRDEALAAGVKDEVLRRLTLVTLLDGEAERMGLKLTRAEVAKFIRTDEMFQNPVTKAFDRERLNQILSQNQLSEQRLEELLRSDLLRQMLFESIEPGPSAPKAMVRNLILHEIEQRRIGYLVVTPDLAGPAAAPTPAALQAFYDKNKDRFKTPEYRTFTAVLIRAEDFAARVAVSEDEMRRTYDATKARLFETPEKRTFYLVTFDKEDAAAAAAAAVRAGRPMEAIARDRGLTLAAVTFTDTSRKDVLDPKVAEAIFAPALQPGGIVGPVKGQLGFAVAQLAGVTPATTQPFEEVRDQIRAEIAKSGARKALIEAVSKFEESRDTGETLAASAQKIGAAPQTFGPVDDKSFAPGGAIVDKIPGVVLAEAFKLDEGSESTVIELPDNGGYAYLTVDAVQPEAVRPYKDVAGAVEALWRADEVRARLSKKAKAIKDAVAGGKTLEAEAAALGRAAFENVFARSGPGNEAISPEFLKALFKASKGAAISAPVTIGDAEVVAVVRDIGFARERIGPGDEAQFSTFLDANMNREFAEAYVEAVKKDVGVRIDQAAVDALFVDQPQ